MIGCVMGILITIRLVAHIKEKQIDDAVLQDFARFAPSILLTGSHQGKTIHLDGSVLYGS